MKQIAKLGLTLMIYTAIAGLLLGFIYTKTKPRIEEQERLAQKEALISVMPEEAKFFEEITLPDSTIVFVGYKDSTKGEAVGFASIGMKYGFSSNVKVMVGILPDFTLTGIRVLSQNETPGLGTHIVDDWFQKQFAGKSIEQLKVDKDGGDIKSITGATISSRTVTGAVEAVVKKLMDNKDALPLPSEVEDEGEDTTDASSKQT